MSQITPSNNSTLISITGADTNVLDFTIGAGGLVIEDSGTLQNGGNLTWNGQYAQGLVVDKGGSLKNGGRLFINGSTFNAGGDIELGGTVVMGPSNSIIINGRHPSGATLYKDSTLTLNKNTNFNSNYIINYGSFVNNGTINMSVVDSDNVIANEGVFHNSSTGKIILTADAPSGIYLQNIGGDFRNDGIIDNSKFPSLTIDQITGFTSSGTYSGTGHVTSDWVNNGDIKPGNSSGGMLFGGSYTQNAGLKEIELGGTEHFDFHRTDTQHDFIEVNGDMNIGENVQLEVSLIDEFELDLDQEFIISKVDGELTGTYQGLEEGAIVGSFDSVYGFDLYLFVTYEAGDGNDIALYTADHLFQLSYI